MQRRDPHIVAASIVQDAGGELVGRTRLQKIAFLLQLAGFGEDFPFEYRHYGPYSEELSQAMEVAVALGPVQEEERVADWGGRYSIYRHKIGGASESTDRALFIQKAKQINAVELELAATAAYLFVKEGIGDTLPGNPWEETRRRKPSKAKNGCLEQAMKSYADLRATPTAKPLPDLPPV